MEINKITPVTFGYSKKSQAYIDEKIAASKDKGFAETLKNYSAMCNDTEELIKKEENKIKTPEEEENYRAHVDLFIGAKGSLLSTIATAFHDGDEYLKSEYDYYDSAYKKCTKDRSDNWRDYLLNVISGWDYTGITERGKERIEKKKAREEAAKKEAAKKAEAQTKIYTPSKSSETKAIVPVGAITPNMSKAQIDAMAEKMLSNAPDGVFLEVLKKHPGSPEGFKDIMGMDELKKELIQDVIEPVKNPEQAKQDFLEYGKKMPTGIMLYGPPGCGKTYIIEALANEIESPVFTLEIGKAGSKYINETSNRIKASMDFVKQCAKAFQRPVILFMDEMDSMTMERGNGNSSSDENLKQVATLLKSIEDVQKHNVIVVGASNKHELIDPAIRRRFETKRFVGAPNADQREAQVRNNLSKKLKAKKLLEDKESMEKIAEALDGYSYHSINIISDEASLNALERNRANIEVQDFRKAIDETNEEKVDEGAYRPKEKALMGFQASALAD